MIDGLDQSGTARGETLDDAIDRVAAALTAVPADDGCAARVTARLDAGNGWRMPWFGLVAGAAVAAAAIAFVVLPASTPRSRMPQPAAPAASSQPSSAPAVAANAADSSTPASPATADRVAIARVLEPLPPSIDALPHPEELSVAGLPLDPLTITPVELERLDVADLGVTELDGGKENQ